MSYVTPNSRIQLFKGINLDNRYMHTVHFANESVQNNTFSGKVFKSYNDLQFRRVNDNQVRIEEDSTVLQGVTYMRFQNKRSGNKWYYAFVLSCDYVNENTSLITYEIDVMQTWFEQGGSVRPCMVKREHVNNDNFGANLESEPVGTDSYDCHQITFFDDFDEMSVIVQSTGEPENEDLYRNGMFAGSKYDAVPCNGNTDAGYVKTLMEQMLGSWDMTERQQEIIDMTTLPSFLYFGYNSRFPAERDIDVRMPSVFTDYTPKNKKLWLYPYSYLLCTTKDGDQGIYKWEYFKDLKPANYATFRRVGTCVGGGQIICYPLWYNGIQSNVDAKVSMSDFPKNAFAYDGYQAWIANGGRTKYQNASDIVAMRGATAVLDTYSSAIDNTTSSINNITHATTAKRPPNPVAVGGSVASNATSTISDIANTAINIAEARNKINYMFRDAAYKPNPVVGQSTPSVAVGKRLLNFYFTHVHIQDDEAKRFDDFFSCYGYNVNAVKSPNLTGRRFWNFVQTENCVINGDMPASSKEAIGRIFDGGITIWHNLDQIGNYQQSVTNGTIDNPII